MQELLTRLLRPYFIAHALFTFYVPIVEHVPLLHRKIFPPASFTTSEFLIEELQLVLAFLFMLGLRMRRMTCAEELLMQFFLYAKLFSMYVLYRYAAWYLLGVFVAAWAVLFVSLQLPGYNGPSRVGYLSETALARAVQSTKIISKDVKRTAWLVHFGADWSPPSKYFEVIFAHLSNKYATSELHFGYVDVDDFLEVATTYSIDTSVSGFGIPAVVLYRNGKEKGRLPLSELQKKTWDRTEQSVEVGFDLEKLIQVLAGNENTEIAENAKDKDAEHES